MSTVSPLPDPESRNAHDDRIAWQVQVRKSDATVCKRLQSAGQNRVAELVGVSESTVSRFVSNGDLKRAIEILAAAGIKCVPSEFRCFDPKDVEVLMHGHKRWAETLESAEQLSWE